MYKTVILCHFFTFLIFISPCAGLLLYFAMFYIISIHECVCNLDGNVLADAVRASEMLIALWLHASTRIHIYTERHTYILCGDTIDESIQTRTHAATCTHNYHAQCADFVGTAAVVTDAGAVVIITCSVAAAMTGVNIDTARACAIINISTNTSADHYTFSPMLWISLCMHAQAHCVLVYADICYHGPALRPW